MTSLRGRVALITGASSGIGQALAGMAARRGAELVLTGRDRDRLARVADGLGGRAMHEALDVRDEGRVHALVRRAKERFGPIDILVNAAGVGFPGPFADGHRDQWQEVLDTNVMGVLQVCSAALPVLSEDAVIVNVSSTAAHERNALDGVYSASKAAVNAFSNCLREELAPSGIRVLVVEPGSVLTSFARNVAHHHMVALGASLGLEPEEIPDFHGRHIPEDFAAEVLRRFPDRFLSPEHVAERIWEAVEAGDPALETLRIEPGR